MTETQQRKFTPYIENISESAAACLFTMVQGNLFAVGLSHLLIASQTGIIAGIIASTALLVSRTHRRWMVSSVLGVVTAVVDYFVHPGMFGPVIVEAIISGIGAAVLSYSVGTLIDWIRLGGKTGTDEIT